MEARTLKNLKPGKNGKTRTSSQDQEFAANIMEAASLLERAMQTLEDAAELSTSYAETASLENFRTRISEVNYGAIGRDGTSKGDASAGLDAWAIQEMRLASPEAAKRSMRSARYAKRP